MFPLAEPWGPCRICGSERVRPIHAYRSRGDLGPKRLLALFGCESCGAAQSVPAPSRHTLDAFYGAAEGWQSRATLDEDRQQRSLVKKRAVYGRRLELLRPALRPPRRDGPPAAFDFGCGLGTWLDVLQDDGWETYGLEPGPVQRRVAARRHHMLEAVPAQERFDLAILNHVLEHLLDPVETLRKIGASIVPGGQIFVSVPDLGRVHVHRRLKYAVNELHLSSFTFSGLRSLLALAGFEVEEHFEAPEWAATEGGREIRLRVLGRRSSEVRFPVEEAPLTHALESLRELGRIESGEARHAVGGL